MNLTKTKHSSTCSRVFKNYDMTCPRCIELANGAEARQGWQTRYFAELSDRNASWQRQLAWHSKNCPICVHGNPGVCTFGES